MTKWIKCEQVLLMPFKPSSNWKAWFSRKHPPTSSSCTRKLLSFQKTCNSSCCWNTIEQTNKPNTPSFVWMLCCPHSHHRTPYLILPTKLRTYAKIKHRKSPYHQSYPTLNTVQWSKFPKKHLFLSLLLFWAGLLLHRLILWLRLFEGTKQVVENIN